MHSSRMTDAIDVASTPRDDPLRSLRPRSTHVERTNLSLAEFRNISSTKKPTTRRLACRSCRQAKIRCDISASVLGRCKRCIERKEECLVDADYKRVNKKNKIAQLQEQIRHLNSVVASTSDRTDSSPRIEIIDDTLSQHDNEATIAAARPLLMQTPDHNTVPTWNDENTSQTALSKPHSQPNGLQSPDTSVPDTATSSRQLEEFAISGVEINKLFKIFFEHFHSFLPILNPSLAPDQYYDRSTLLFWVIIAVASRHYKDDPTLITVLASPISALLWRRISNLPHTLDLVQATLLLSTWPFSVSTMNTDPSLTLLSIAKASLLTLGLHRPESIRDFMRFNAHLSAEEIQEAVRTWAGCYVVAQSVTVAVGQPPLFGTDWAIDRACRIGSIYELPLNFRHLLLIQQFSNSVSHIMAGNRDSSTGIPFEDGIGLTLAYLERSYDDVQIQIGQNLTAYNNIMLVSAGLQLRAFYFFQASSTRQLGLLKAYSTALALITSCEAATKDSDFVIYSPAHFGHILLLAGIVILKILHSSISAMVDFAGGKRAFNLAVILLRQKSLEDNDLPGRSSKILTQLWALQDTLASKGGQWQEPSLHLRSRSSASVMHDALWVWRDSFDKRSGPHPRGPDLPSPSTDDTAGISSTDLSNCNTTSHHNESGQGFNAEDLNGLQFDVEEMTAIWDLNIPPLLPMDFDAYAPRAY